MTLEPGHAESRADSELAELPPPRRPWRKATLFVLWLGAIGSAFLSLAVLSDVGYALRTGDPVEVAELDPRRFDQELADRWVRGAGELSTNAIRYRRPLERDSYRLAQLSAHPRVCGIRHRALPGAVSQAGLGLVGDDAWLLLDGESPRGLRWMLGLFALLLAFFSFNVVGLSRLLRPIAPVAGHSR
jgi:hypothetical protein